MELEIEKFSPTVAELQGMAAEAQAITSADSPETVKEARKKLKAARTSIAKMGKMLREDVVAFQKKVIAKEKELIAIIEPEEERLEEIEIVQMTARVREERRALLPTRKQRLDSIGDDFAITDEELLDMDSNQFEGYYNQRLAAKNESDRQELEAEKAKLEQDKRQENREQELKDAEERGRKEAADKLEREQKEKQEQEALDQAKLEKDKKYKAFLKQHGYVEDPLKFWTVQEGNEVRLYKFLGKFEK